MRLPNWKNPRLKLAKTVSLTEDMTVVLHNPKKMNR